MHRAWSDPLCVALTPPLSSRGCCCCASAGTETKRLQLFPSATAPNLTPEADPLSCLASHPPPHPLVHPASDGVRWLSEIAFVRSMISELLVGTGEWELNSLHRLFNADWIAQFHSRQKAIAPALFHSSAVAAASADGCGSLFSPHSSPSSSVLFHLLRIANDSPAGVPVFAWHGTKNAGQTTGAEQCKHAEEAERRGAEHRAVRRE